MNIELTPEQCDFVQRAIKEGRVKSIEDGVQAALELWVETQRRRDELLSAIDEGDASLSDGTDFTWESLLELTEDVKRRGRARISEARKVSR